MTSKEGELKIFEEKSLYDFLEDMSQIDLDKIAEELLKNPEEDLIKIYENCSMNPIKGNLI